jgi:hypothetical protein
MQSFIHHGSYLSRKGDMMPHRVPAPSALVVAILYSSRFLYCLYVLKLKWDIDQDGMIAVENAGEPGYTLLDKDMGQVFPILASLGF